MYDHSRILLHCLVALLLYLTQRVQCQLTKCCSTGLVLTKNGFSYVCESPASSVDWNSYNIPFSPNSIPYNCMWLGNPFEGNINYVEMNGCVDKDLNNQFVAVSCSPSPVSGVHLLSKCCPSGQSYDYGERNCIRNPDSPLHFNRLLGNAAVVFQNKVPDCSEDEVFVEYFSKYHWIRFEGMNLEVNGNLLPRTKFCIEDLVNIDPGEASGDEKHFIVRSCRERSICNEVPCIRRCCKTDQFLKKGKGAKSCLPHPSNKNLNPTFHDVSLPLSDTQTQIGLKEYGILQSLNCKKIMRLNPDDPDDLHYLHKNGMLYVAGKDPYDTESYCIENIINPQDSTETYTFTCFDGESYEESAKFKYYPYGLLISCVFLALTLFVYSSIPKLLNLHGKTLVCYVISFLAAYIILSIVQFKQKQSYFCYEVAFLLLYCFLSAFCWQTVMCFDIWWTFGSLRSSFVMQHNKRKQRKFLWYSAYAWGVPLAWTIFTIYAEKFRPFENQWNPSIAVNTCFFNSRTNWRNHFLFFILPAGLHVIFNCILFVITAIHCSRVKQEIHRMQCETDDSSNSAKRKKFRASRAMFVLKMNLKLFTVMGTSWVLELISTFSTNEIIQMVLDTYNIFYGVFIFIIFVFKQTVLRELKHRFGLKVENTGTTASRSTTTTHSGRINMKDVASNKSLPLLASSTVALQTIGK